MRPIQDQQMRCSTTKTTAHCKTAQCTPYKLLHRTLYSSELHTREAKTPQLYMLLTTRYSSTRRRTAWHNVFQTLQNCKFRPQQAASHTERHCTVCQMDTVEFCSTIQFYQTRLNTNLLLLFLPKMLFTSPHPEIHPSHPGY